MDLLKDCQKSSSKLLKLFQFSIIVMIIFTFMKAIFPEEVKAIGDVAVPLEKLGVSASKDKLIYVLADGLSDRFTNKLGPAQEGTIFGRFTIF